MKVIFKVRWSGGGSHLYVPAPRLNQIFSKDTLTVIPLMKSIQNVVVW